MGCPCLSFKFSASKFWDEINQHQATVFNAIGAMIPILYNQPDKLGDRDNSVRLLLSAACPADYLEKNLKNDLESKFGVLLGSGWGPSFYV